MTPYYQDSATTIYRGDCLDVLASLPDASVHAIVTDPPYGLGFMGKSWDALPPGKEWAEQCLRVLKPGGHLLAFGGTRTWHRLAVAVEDAGFEIRDSIAWLYGSGFPKSLDVSKAIDKAVGAERKTKAWLARERSGVFTDGTERTATSGNLQCAICLKWKFAPDHCVCPRDNGPQTPDAEQHWSGWGTALKPAFEPIVVGRKPLAGTVAANVLAYGTGALHVDATRIGVGGGGTRCTNRDDEGKCRGHKNAGRSTSGETFHGEDSEGGRWPANVVLDESQADELDAAARFFYVAKASKRERPVVDGVAHPTVKPLALMRWLVRLVTPPGGTVLEPFAGSGTTVEAALLEGFDVIAVEREAEYLPLIQARIDRARGALSEPVQGEISFEEKVS